MEQLLNFRSLAFKWKPTPNFRLFFYIYDLTLIHPDYVEVKLGYFIGFAIMDFLLFNLLKNHKYAIAISIVSAFITEFFQLFFGKDGGFMIFQLIL
ncbi:hypothetical protein [Neobacillus cucumis]|uniref:hypothetical protein n=1 Tax=Neobacillus cucumis TaxID=1740721 RepID=UPI002E21D096|nr:hypothetical protein [Neobacillus cucumis]